MFRIRKVQDDLYPSNRHAVDQVKQILRVQFSEIQEDKIQQISEQLHDPLKFKFRSLMFVSENLKGRVNGFALMMHAPDLNYCFLDYIATRKDNVSTGIGGALYNRCREEAMLLKVTGIYMESLPDDQQICLIPELLKQNASRLKFWESFGVRPVMNTLYETPVKADDKCPPYLLLDTLGNNATPAKEQARRIVESILRRKYGDYCPEEYILMVKNSFQDDHVMLRPFRYKKKVEETAPSKPEHHRKPVVLTSNQSHTIHHIKEKGYVESPVRIRKIMSVLKGSPIFQEVPLRVFAEKEIREIHSAGMINFLKEVSVATSEGTMMYPYVFPIRNPDRKPKELGLLAGYYCMDTFTPVHKHVWDVAREAVDCALTCASYLLEGYPMGYALVRPPGHHAEANIYGGFCYLNSASIAANFLSKFGNVALLDIDYHHGNGHQEIFYKRNDVLTISLHGHPTNTYPYFCGFKDEKGEGPGLGFNHNFPVKEESTAADYRIILADALKIITRYNPAYLVVSFGLDLAKGDPTGTFSFVSKDFEKLGKMIGSQKKPVLVVQEGGYNTANLGINALHFLEGLYGALV